LRPWWTARRQGAVDESRRDSLLQKSVIAGVPEIVERAGSVDGRVAFRVGDRCSDHEFVNLYAVGGEGGCGQQERQSGENPEI
jgi:hypothetical protein